MLKKLQKTDRIFILALFVGLLLHLTFIFFQPYLVDETYYVTVPLRLIAGDSLIQHEWHLTQFSSIFLYLPVYFWLQIKGSSDGIILFLRFFYLVIHTGVAVVIYKFFRKYELWAVMSARIFYTQSPYRLLAINYQSMFVLFLLFLTLCLLSIYEEKKIFKYILAGFCFGGCCICNPLFCIAFVIYFVVCMLWPKRDKLKNAAIKIKAWNSLPEGKNINEKTVDRFNAFPEMENYNCFFSKKALICSTFGISVMAVAAIIYFFQTGGTIDSIINNFTNLLGSSEYSIVSAEKLAETFTYFEYITVYFPIGLPLFFIVILHDKKRKTSQRRYLYIIISFILAFVYMHGIMAVAHFKASFFSLPLSIFSTVCYILTENKNKKLFYCLWVPSAIAAFFDYLAANTLLTAIGIVFAVNNIAGVFFIADLLKEMVDDTHSRTKSIKMSAKRVIKTSFILMNAVLCMQLIFHGVVYSYEQLPIFVGKKPDFGTYEGFHMFDDQYENYLKTIEDMDNLKRMCDEDDPVLIATYDNWLYMYLDQPYATYTTWYDGMINSELLTAYYIQNPEKIPKYIYIDYFNHDGTSPLDVIREAKEMFEFTQTEMSNGKLLTITDCTFD